MYFQLPSCQINCFYMFIYLFIHSLLYLIFYLDTYDQLYLVTLCIFRELRIKSWGNSCFYCSCWSVNCSTEKKINSISKLQDRTKFRSCSNTSFLRVRTYYFCYSRNFVLHALLTLVIQIMLMWHTFFVG